MVEETARVVLTVACVASIGLQVGCKKKAVPQDKAEGRAELSEPEPARDEFLPSDEVKRIAKERFNERKGELKPFDEDTALRDLVYEKYKIDLSNLFADGKYDFTQLKSLKEVKAVLDDRAKEIVDKSFPDSMREKLVQQADVEFPHHKIGDFIEITYAHASGRTSTEKGTLEMAAPDRIVVSGHRIGLNDLRNPPSYTFDAMKVRKRRADHVYYNYTLPRSRAKKKVKDELQADVFKEFGVVELNGEWVSLREAHRKVLESELMTLQAEHEKAEQNKLKEQVIREMRTEGLIE